MSAKIDRQWILEKVRKYGAVKIANTVMMETFPAGNLAEPRSCVDVLAEFCKGQGFTWDEDWVNGCFVVRDPTWTEERD